MASTSGAPEPHDYLAQLLNGPADVLDGAFEARTDAADDRCMTDAAVIAARPLCNQHDTSSWTTPRVSPPRHQGKVLCVGAQMESDLGLDHGHVGTG